jgi:hypothetical protein
MTNNESKNTVCLPTSEVRIVNPFNGYQPPILTNKVIEISSVQTESEANIFENPKSEYSETSPLSADLSEPYILTNKFSNVHVSPPRNRTTTPLGMYVLEHELSSKVGQEWALLRVQEDHNLLEKSNVFLKYGFPRTKEEAQRITSLEIIQKIWFVHKDDPSITFQSIYSVISSYKKFYGLTKKEEKFVVEQLYVAVLRKEENTKKEIIQNTKNCAIPFISNQFLELASRFHVQCDVIKAILRGMGTTIPISLQVINAAQIALNRLPIYDNSFVCSYISASQFCALQELDGEASFLASKLHKRLCDDFKAQGHLARAIISDTIALLQSRQALKNYLLGIDYEDVELQTGYTISDFFVQSSYRIRDDYCSDNESDFDEPQVQMFNAGRSVFNAISKSGETVSSINDFAKSAETLVPKAHELLSAMEGSTVKLKSLAERATSSFDGIDQATSAATSSLGSMETLTTSLSSLPENLKVFVMHVWEEYGDIVIPILVIILCDRFLKSKHPRLSLIIQTIASLWGAFKGCGLMQEVVQNCLSTKKNQMHVQSDSVFTSLAVLGYTIAGVNYKNSERMIPDFVKMLQAIPRGSDGLDKIVEAVRTVLGFLLQFVNKNVADAVYHACCYGVDTDFTTYVEQVNNLCIENNVGLKITQVNRMRIHDLIVRGESILATMSKKKEEHRGLIHFEATYGS